MLDALLDALPKRGGAPALNDLALLAEVGRGAFGVVYAAWDGAGERPVAVKFLLDASGEREARFRREGAILAGMDDPSVVQLIDSGRLGPLPYLVLEWVAGRSFDAVVADAGPLTDAEALTVLRDVGQALLALHARGVVHRDIKPANLLLRAADGRIKLADLGVAKAAGEFDSLRTRDRALMGTPAFMSPEQVAGAADAGPASDLFSLGMTAYALLTGLTPFAADNIFETLGRVKDMPLPGPVVGDRLIPPATWRVLEALTAKEPANRPASAARLLEMLPGASVPFRPAVLAAAAPVLTPAPPRGDRGTLAGGGTVAPTHADSQATIDHRAGVDRPAVSALLFCQCLQNDFVATTPPPHGEPPFTSLHVGPAEALRLVGPDPASGPLVSAVARAAGAGSVGLVFVRDWHDRDDPEQRAELDFFGDHCLMGTWGAANIDALEAFSRDRRRTAVIDSTGINDCATTPLLDVTRAWISPAERARLPVGVVGVWTDVKVHYLLYDLQTRGGFRNLATCAELVASPNADAHEATLRHLAAVLNVRVFDTAGEFLAFLGA